MGHRSVQENQPTVLAFIIRFVYFIIIAGISYIAFKFFLREIFENDKILRILIVSTFDILLSCKTSVPKSDDVKIKTKNTYKYFILSPNEYNF